MNIVNLKKCLSSEEEFDTSPFPATKDDVVLAEKILNVKFGAQLVCYLINFGYIGFKSAEFYGINSVQKEKSDLIIQTKYLNEYFKKTVGYIAFENYVDGCYILIDNNDRIYRYLTVEDEIEPYNMSLFEYIEKRFNEELLIQL